MNKLKLTTVMSFCILITLLCVAVFMLFNLNVEASQMRRGAFHTECPTDGFKCILISGGGWTIETGGVWGEDLVYIGPNLKKGMVVTER